MFRHFAYGLGIHSDFRIPDFPEADVPCDVRIRLEPQDRWLESRIPEPYVEAGYGETTLAFEPVVFLVRRGQEIWVTPVHGADVALIRLYLVGKVMATLLYQRGLFVLHASSVEVNGQAVAFVGDSGLGKSSCAAALHSCGCGFVADDVSAVNLCSPVATVMPAFPQLKIDPEVASSLGYDLDRMSWLHPMEAKRGLRVDDRFTGRPVPLGLVYLLREADGAISPHELLVELVRHSYPARLGQSGGAPHLRQCASLAKLVPVIPLARSNTPPKPSELANRACKDLRWAALHQRRVPVHAG